MRQVSDEISLIEDFGAPLPNAEAPQHCDLSPSIVRIVPFKIWTHMDDTNLAAITWNNLHAYLRHHGSPQCLDARDNLLAPLRTEGTTWTPNQHNTEMKYFALRQTPEEATVRIDECSSSDLSPELGQCAHEPFHKQVLRRCKVGFTLRDGNTKRDYDILGVRVKVGTRKFHGLGLILGRPCLIVKRLLMTHYDFGALSFIFERLGNSVGFATILCADTSTTSNRGPWLHTDSLARALHRLGSALNIVRKPGSTGRATLQPSVSPLKFFFVLFSSLLVYLTRGRRNWLFRRLAIDYFLSRTATRIGHRLSRIRGLVHGWDDNRSGDCSSSSSCTGSTTILAGGINLKFSGRRGLIKILRKHFKL